MPSGNGRQLSIVAWLGVAIVLSLTVFMLSVGPERSSTPQFVRQSDPTESPLGPDAVEISLEAARSLTLACMCPWLPVDGPANPQHVDKAWYDPAFDALAFELDSGLLVTYHPDSRTVEQFIAADQAMIEDGIPIQFGSLRGTTASTIVANADGRGSSSSVAWLEGLDRIIIYGEVGQSVDDLMPIASAMIPAS